MLETSPDLGVYGSAQEETDEALVSNRPLLPSRR